MNPTDFLIIYLAFGAPVAVYKYLQNRSSSPARRLASSAVTFFFWVPAAVRIGYLYFTNADLADAFVSRSAEEVEFKRVCSIRDSLATELIRTAGGLSVHDVRDTIERYTGLSSAAAGGYGLDVVPHPLLAAAGRGDDPIGTACLDRRNRNRLERHLKWARQDFLMLFEYLPPQPGAMAVCNIGVELARGLQDDIAVKELTDRMAKQAAKWTQQSDGRSTAIFTKHPTRLGISTTSINAD